MNNLIETIGGRKAAACLTGLVVVVGCFLYKGNLPRELIDAVQYLVTTYLAGNVVSDVVASATNVSVKKAEAQAAAPEAPKYDDTAITQRLAFIEQGLAAQDQTLRQVVSVIQGGKA